MANPKIQKQIITDTLKENYMPYAMSVIISRAIPEIDGFKPAQRKILYTMYNMGLMKPGVKHVKCANIVGAGMRLNPHGDTTLYDTMVRMTVGNETLLFPFVDSKGSFGKHYSRDMAPAAYRYTEARLTKSCEVLFRDIDKNSVEFVDNYDNTMKEPVLLPVLFPTILVNPNQGIAVGMASNICSFNLKEVCETTIALLKDKKADIMETLLAPDFTTGGNLIYNKNELKEIYETGKGSFKVQAVWNYDKKHRIIEITEIPFSTTVEVIIEKVTELVKNGKIKTIDNIRDETDLKGLKIAIDLKRGADPEDVMNKLFKQTTLLDTFSCNFNILVNGNPKVMGVREILLNWIDFRMNCVKNSLAYDIDKKKKRLHLLQGVEKVALDIDKAIKIIRGTDSEDDVIPLLMKKFKIDETQANYIAEIKLRNLNKSYFLNLTKDISGLEKDILNLESILGSDRKLKNLISKELKDIISKYGENRKTKIVKNYKEPQLEEEMEEASPCVLILTNEHYVKRLNPASYKASPEQKLKDGDKIIETVDGDTNIELMVFNNKGEAYKTRVSAFDETKSNVLGEYLPSFVEMPPAENPVFSCSIDDSSYLLFCFKNGKIARVPMSAYRTIKNRKKLAHAYYENSPLIKVVKCKAEDNIVVESTLGKSFMIKASMIPEKTTKNSMGVSVLKCDDGKSTFKDVYINNDIKVFAPKSLPSKGK